MRTHGHSSQSPAISVQRLVSDVRRRWRRRALVQGAALCLLTFAIAGGAFLALQLALEATPRLLTMVLVAGVAVVLGVIVWYVVRPGMRRLTDRQIALFIEEKYPELEDRLNAAVEVQDGPALRAAHSILLDRLIDDASKRAKAVPITTVVDRKRERILSYASAAFTIVFLIFLISSLDEIRTGMEGVGLSSLVTPTQPLMTITPGDAEIEKGASQEIVVELRTDTDRDVTLSYKTGEGEWAKATMEKGLGASAFLYEFFDVQEPIRYFVEYDGHRSEPFTISLYEFPAVDRIDVTYAYPDYTQKAPETEEDTGDIRALKGTRATVTVRATGTVETASMELDDGTSIPLKASGDGTFEGSLVLEERGLYHVSLVDARSKTNKFPEEYQIVPVDDEKPLITVTEPQRDVRANAIEEVLVAAKVQDDVGVKDVRLRYTVNGGEEQDVELMDAAAARGTEVQGEHLFFLEDFGLEPGDVVSYYVEAEDYFDGHTPEVSDMYFIEVIPYDQKYTQAENQGNMQGGQPSGIVLSQQQVIAATWNLIRRRDGMDDDAFSEAAADLAQAQANLKQNIEERINNTAFSLELRGNETNQQIVAHLRDAVGEMEKALGRLEAASLDEALTPERRALNHLLKADALNQERQVALNRQGQRGAGGATEERMTDLMDLELDISKDKYEVQQQRPSQQQQQELNETLQRLRELARRQQNLANQSRPDDVQGEDRRRQIERLKRDQDQLRQQTESLASSLRRQARGDEQRSRAVDDGLERVAQNMRDAQEALRREDQQQARTHQQQALNELNRLQQQLQNASNDGTRRQLDQLTQDFDRLRDQEAQLSNDLDRAVTRAQSRGGADEEDMEQLHQARQRVQEALQQLDAQAEDVEEQNRDVDPDLANDARNLRQRLRREALEDLMEKSEAALDEGWLDYAARVEEEIQTGIQRLDSQMRAFAGRRPVTDEEQTSRALEDVRALAEQLRQMQQQAGQRPPAATDRQGAQQGRDSGAPGAGADRQAQADAARMQQQLERMRETVDRLQRDMQGNAQAQQQLRGLRAALNDASFTGTLLDGEAADDYFKDRVYDPLSQLELALSRRLDRIALEKKLYGARPADVPPEYRELVEKYYESLSKTNEN